MLAIAIGYVDNGKIMIVNFEENRATLSQPGFDKGIEESS